MTETEIEYYGIGSDSFSVYRCVYQVEHQIRMPVGKPTPLDPRYDLKCYSDPHCWSAFYWGSVTRSSRQLALAILCDSIGDERALLVHEDFLTRHIANMRVYKGMLPPREDQDSWKMTKARVIALAEEIERERSGVLVTQ